MFPALAVTTPAASSSSLAWRTAFPAPRSLNELTGWSVSSLRKISASASASSRTRGVLITSPRIVSRARRMSSSGIRAFSLLSEVDVDADAVGHSSAVDVLCGGEILRREAERLEEGQLAGGAAALGGADQDF